MKRILTIAGSDSGGGAGIQADLKTITLVGGFGMSVLTALTAQNTVGVDGIHPVPVEFIGQQLDAVLSDIGADAVKTGMLFNANTIEIVADRLSAHGVEILVVDPVMVAKGGDVLLVQEARETLVSRLILRLTFPRQKFFPEDRSRLKGTFMRQRAPYTPWGHDTFWSKAGTWLAWLQITFMTGKSSLNFSRFALTHPIRTARVVYTLLPSLHTLPWSSM
jgi:hypothetical protein